MIKVALRGLMTRKLRAVLTGIAIVLGVAMISGTYILTDTVQRAFTNLLVDSYAGTDAVVTGKGSKSFSAGGDFYAMKRLNFTNACMWNDRMLGLAMTIRGLPIPVIAMVNGWCMGGGHELALWCVLVIA